MQILQGLAKIQLLVLVQNGSRPPSCILVEGPTDMGTSSQFPEAVRKPNVVRISLKVSEISCQN